MAEVEAISGSVPVPEEFFTELLPRIVDLAELKVTLHTLEITGRRESSAVSLDDLTAPAVLRSVVGTNSPEPAEVRLQRILGRAVANGSLLRLRVQGPERSTVYFLPSTRENRELIRRLQAGEPEAAWQLQIPVEGQASVYRPNVFALYEQHIGPLTPLTAEQLRQAERSYPRAWIEEAFLEAVQYNRRSWRYVETILNRWEESGGPDRVSGGQR